MLSRLVRGCIALACTACVLAVACSRRLADAVKGGQLSYMTPAMQREQSTYRSLLTRTDRYCVLAVACSRLADAVKGGQLRYMALPMERE